MTEDNQFNGEEIKTDLKHDTLEFSAATDGDDKLDMDDIAFEEDEITAAELDGLEEDDFEGQAYALNTAETDKLADADNLPEESWEDDLPDNDTEADADNEQRRK